MQASGRWAVCRPGRSPVEITWGYPFRIEVAPGPHLLTSFPSCARANSGFLAPLLSAARYPNAAQRLENLGAVNRPWK